MKNNFYERVKNKTSASLFLLFFFSLLSYTGYAQCPLGSSIKTSYAASSTGGYTASTSGNGTGAPNGQGVDAFSAPSGAIFNYNSPFQGGDKITITAKFMDAGRLDKFKLLVSDDGVTWTTATSTLALTGSSATAYQNKVFTLPTSLAGSFKYIKLEGVSDNSYWDVDAVKVDATLCKQFVANSFFDNGVGGGTASDCVKNGGESNVTASSGLYYNFIQNGAVVKSVAVPDTINGVPDGTYTMIISKKPTDVVPNLTPYTCSNNSQTVTMAGGVPTPSTISFCVFAKDTDGDGIPDDKDLDDDNDGIIDTDEDACTPAAIGGDPSLNWDANFNPLPGKLEINYDTPGITNTSTVSYGAGSPCTACTETTWGGLKAVNTGINTTAKAIAANQYIQYTLNAVADKKIHSLTQWTSYYDVGTPSSNIAIAVADNPSFANSQIIYDGANTEGVGYFAHDLSSTYTLLPTKTYYIRAYLYNADGSQNLPFDSFGFITTCVADYDVDGIPNSLDLDSDNDGCTDAVEGGAAFTNANLVASSVPGGNTAATVGTYKLPVVKNLGTTVDANGVPTIALGGQSIGTSQNEATLDANCVICKSGDIAPTVSATTKSNVCPATTADISGLVTSTCPTGSTLEWHTSATPSSTNIVAAANAVVAGTYYAVCHDSAPTPNSCYSPASSGVVVTINACCAAGTVAPTLNKN